MRYIGTIILWILLISSMIAQTAIAPEAGDGSINDPYEIASLENLYWIAAGDDVVPEPDRESRWASNYIQTADIDASDTSSWFGGEGWSPIGIFVAEAHPDNLPFSGSFDGQENIVDSLFINRSDVNVLGLFGYTEGALIENLGVTNVEITGWRYVSAIIGYQYDSTITNCYSTGTIEAGLDVGGIVGLQESNSIVSNCFSTVNITSTSRSGGLVGASTFSYINDSFSMGNITGSSMYIGGLLGYQGNATVSNCFSMGNVNGSQRVGGLMGEQSNSVTINSYSTGSVSGNEYVGGLVGIHFGSNVFNSYYNTETSGQSDDDGRGEPRTTEEMTYPHATNTYIDWDFTDLWSDDFTYQENEGYPYFQWQWYVPQSDHPLVGNGEPGNPYEIETLANLYWIAEDNLRWAYHYVQITDIDASDTENWFGGRGWSPIGVWVEWDHPENVPFTGYYDGQGYTIDAHSINRQDTDGLGLLGYINGGEIANLGITNAGITGDSYIGGLAGYIEDSLISNCFITGEISGNLLVGGLAGSLASGATIINCYSTVNINGEYYAGSLVGIQTGNSEILESYSTGSVTGHSQVGGLVGGQENGASINGSYSTGDVSGYSSVGGLVGRQVTGSTVQNSYSTGIVDAPWDTGGLVGSQNESTISNCYSTGGASGEESIGGLVGFMSANSIISNSYSTASANGQAYIGGLVGSQTINSTIVDSYSTGSVEGNDYIGGLVGREFNSSASNSYWDMETSGQTSSAGGEGRTTEEMTYPYTVNTYVGWDFNDIWSADELHEANNGYPYLTYVTLSLDEDVIEVLEKLFLTNYPNPFNPETTIRYSLKEDVAMLELKIFNIRGQLVRTLVRSSHHPEGEFQVVWDGKNDLGQPVTSGVYLYRMTAPGFEKVNKMLLLK